MNRGVAISNSNSADGVLLKEVKSRAHRVLDLFLARPAYPSVRSFLGNWLFWVALMTAAPPPYSTAAGESTAARLQRIYRETRARFQASQSNSVEAAWQLGRACFDLADLAKRDSDRAALAEEGIAACRLALARKYGSAPTHYYLAMNLGQLARTKSIGALKLVREMEPEFKQAIELDEKFDYAGPHRSLGLLYKDAPGWPTSIGSRSKARLHLRRANDLSPDYPDNRLCLLEASFDWGETKGVLEQLSSLDEFLVIARKRFSGEEGELSWRRWVVRAAKLKNKSRSAGEKTATPRGRNR